MRAIPRAKGENRGGARTGTPGATYGNRTDLNVNRADTGVSPEGALQTPAAGGYEPPPAPVAPSRGPDDSPMLTDPTNRPGEPVTTGLGVPPEPMSAEWDVLKAALPDFKMVANTWAEVSPTFKSLISYLENR